MDPCGAMEMLPTIERLVKRWWDDGALSAEDLARLQRLQKTWQQDIWCHDECDVDKARPVHCPYGQRGHEWLACNGYRNLYDFLDRIDFAKLKGSFPRLVASIDDRGGRLPGSGFSKK